MFYVECLLATGRSTFLAMPTGSPGLGLLASAVLAQYSRVRRRSLWRAA